MKSGPSLAAQKRAKQLNEVLYEHITSILGSGEITPELSDKGFHVIRVDIATDFNIINVRWQGSGNKKDEFIEELLPKCSSELRSALIKLRVMGQVPEVQFVKDLSASRLEEIEYLLSIADMGPDHKETPLAHYEIDRPTKIDLRESISQVGSIFHNQDHHTSGDYLFGVKELTNNKNLSNQSGFEAAEMRYTSDAYEIDRAGFASKIIQMKNKTLNRGGDSSFNERVTEGFKKYTADMQSVNVSDIKKVVQSRKRKEEFTDIINFRKVRHKDAILSPLGQQELERSNNAPANLDDQLDWREEEEYYDEKSKT